MRLSRQVIRFAGIGVVSTAAYVVLYAVLRSAMPAQPANGVALITTAIGNTVANRRLTFGSDGRRTAWQDQAVGMLALGMALVITTGALDLLQALGPRVGPGRRAGGPGRRQRAGDRGAIPAAAGVDGPGACLRPAADGQPRRSSRTTGMTRSVRFS